MPATYFHGTMTKTNLIIKRAIRSRIPAYYGIVRALPVIFTTVTSDYFIRIPKENVIIRTSVFVQSL